MILDGRTLPDGIFFAGDVAILGAGPAGITLALELMGKGLKILLIEAGGPDQRNRDLSSFQGEIPENSAHPSLNLYRTQGLGGTSTIWGGRCVPFDPIDFEPRAHIPDSGWPISYESMLPWYERAMSYCEAGPFRFRVEQALGEKAAPMVPDFHSPDVQQHELERFSCPTDFGRRYGALLRKAPDITTILWAACTAIERSPSGEAIEALTLRTPAGRQFQVRARHYVLATGGLETPRLLLANKIGGDNVGRYYMCHIEGKAATARFRPGSKIVFAYEPDRHGIYVRRVFSFPPALQRQLGMTNLILRFEPPVIADPGHGSPVLSALYLAHSLIRPEYGVKLAARGYRDQASRSAAIRIGRHGMNVLRGAPQLACFAVDWARRRWLARRKLPYLAITARDGTYNLDYNAEQVPNPDSRVSLTNEQCPLGLPRIRVDWRVSSIDLDGVVTAHRHLAARMEESGIGQLTVDEEAIRHAYKPMGGHHIGTARMAEDSSRGVVDRNCRVFGTENLYIAGSATFPTSSHANPTLTIVAMAARLAGHLQAKGMA
ncbi:GMC oxidoreductase [Telmatospirillum sp. J64-1]|uniref:GMC oxidoreductase n=1 Tax=Telmatospirillum sp. J64-1 TaxID=2502183 RepID=UPI00163DDDED|nr:GMC family oxidoreductase [Telmatospirillum sp. J64-1]